MTKEVLIASELKKLTAELNANIDSAASWLSTVEAEWVCDDVAEAAFYYYNAVSANQRIKAGKTNFHRIKTAEDAASTPAPSDIIIVPPQPPSSQSVLKFFYHVNESAQQALNVDGEMICQASLRAVKTEDAWYRSGAEEEVTAGWIKEKASAVLKGVLQGHGAFSNFVDLADHHLNGPAARPDSEFHVQLVTEDSFVDVKSGFFFRGWHAKKEGRRFAHAMQALSQTRTELLMPAGTCEASRSDLKATRIGVGSIAVPVVVSLLFQGRLFSAVLLPPLISPLPIKVEAGSQLAYYDQMLRASLGLGSASSESATLRYFYGADGRYYVLDSRMASTDASDPANHAVNPSPMASGNANYSRHEGLSYTTLRLAAEELEEATTGVCALDTTLTSAAIHQMVAATDAIVTHLLRHHLDVAGTLQALSPSSIQNANLSIGSVSITQATTAAALSAKELSCILKAHGISARSLATFRQVLIRRLPFVVAASGMSSEGLIGIHNDAASNSGADHTNSNRSLESPMLPIAAGNTTALSPSEPLIVSTMAKALALVDEQIVLRTVKALVEWQIVFTTLEESFAKLTVDQRQAAVIAAANKVIDPLVNPKSAAGREAYLDLLVKPLLLQKFENGAELLGSTATNGAGESEMLSYPFSLSVTVKVLTPMAVARYAAGSNGMELGHTGDVAHGTDKTVVTGFMPNASVVGESCRGRIGAPTADGTEVVRMSNLGDRSEQWVALMDRFAKLTEAPATPELTSLLEAQSQSLEALLEICQRHILYHLGRSVANRFQCDLLWSLSKVRQCWDRQQLGKQTPCASRAFAFPLTVVSFEANPLRIVGALFDYARATTSVFQCDSYFLACLSNTLRHYSRIVGVKFETAERSALLTFWSKSIVCGYNGLVGHLAQDLPSTEEGADAERASLLDAVSHVRSDMFIRSQPFLNYSSLPILFDEVIGSATSQNPMESREDVLHAIAVCHLTGDSLYCYTGSFIHPAVAQGCLIAAFKLIFGTSRSANAEGLTTPMGIAYGLCAMLRTQQQPATAAYTMAVAVGLAQSTGLICTVAPEAHHIITTKALPLFRKLADTTLTSTAAAQLVNQQLLEAGQTIIQELTDLVGALDSIVALGSGKPRRNRRPSMEQLHAAVQFDADEDERTDPALQVVSVAHTLALMITFFLESALPVFAKKGAEAYFDEMADGGQDGGLLGSGSSKPLLLESTSKNANLDSAAGSVLVIPTIDITTSTPMMSVSEKFLNEGGGDVRNRATTPSIRKAAAPAMTPFLSPLSGRPSDHFPSPAAGNLGSSMLIRDGEDGAIGEDLDPFWGLVDEAATALTPAALALGSPVKGARGASHSPLNDGSPEGRGHQQLILPGGESSPNYGNHTRNPLDVTALMAASPTTPKTARSDYREMLEASVFDDLEFSTMSRRSPGTGGGKRRAKGRPSGLTNPAFLTPNHQPKSTSVGQSPLAASLAPFPPLSFSMSRQNINAAVRLADIPISAPVTSSGLARNYLPVSPMHVTGSSPSLFASIDFGVNSYRPSGNSPQQSPQVGRSLRLSLSGGALSDPGKSFDFNGLPMGHEQPVLNIVRELKIPVSPRIPHVLKKTPAHARQPLEETIKSIRAKPEPTVDAMLASGGLTMYGGGHMPLRTALPLNYIAALSDALRQNGPLRRLFTERDGVLAEAVELASLRDGSNVEDANQADLNAMAREELHHRLRGVEDRILAFIEGASQALPPMQLMTPPSPLPLAPKKQQHQRPASESPPSIGQLPHYKALTTAHPSAADVPLSAPPVLKSTRPNTATDDRPAETAKQDSIDNVPPQSARTTPIGTNTTSLGRQRPKPLPQIPTTPATSSLMAPGGVASLPMNTPLRGSLLHHWNSPTNAMASLGSALSRPRSVNPNPYSMGDGREGSVNANTGASLYDSIRRTNPTPTQPDRTQPQQATPTPAALLELISAMNQQPARGVDQPEKRQEDAPQPQPVKLEVEGASPRSPFMTVKQQLQGHQPRHEVPSAGIPTVSQPDASFLSPLAEAPSQLSQSSAAPPERPRTANAFSSDASIDIRSDDGGDSIVADRMETAEGHVALESAGKDDLLTSTSGSDHNLKVQTNRPTARQSPVTQQETVISPPQPAPPTNATSSLQQLAFSDAYQQIAAKPTALLVASESLLAASPNNNDALTPAGHSRTIEGAPNGSGLGLQTHSSSANEPQGLSMAAVLSQPNESINQAIYKPPSSAFGSQLNSIASVKERPQMVATPSAQEKEEAFLLNGNTRIDNDQQPQSSTQPVVSAPSIAATTRSTETLTEGQPPTKAPVVLVDMATSTSWVDRDVEAVLSQGTNTVAAETTKTMLATTEKSADADGQPSTTTQPGGAKQADQAAAQVAPSVTSQHLKQPTKGSKLTVPNLSSQPGQPADVVKPELAFDIEIQPSNTSLYSKPSNEVFVPESTAPSPAQHEVTSLSPAPVKHASQQPATYLPLPRPLFAAIAGLPLEDVLPALLSDPTFKGLEAERNRLIAAVTRMNARAAEGKGGDEEAGLLRASMARLERTEQKMTDLGVIILATHGVDIRKRGRGQRCH